MMTSRYSSYGTGWTVGRIVRLTPNGRVGQRSRPPDLLVQRGGRRLGERGEEAERAGVRHGGDELGRADPHHPAADDGVLDPELFREARADHPGRRSWLVAAARDIEVCAVMSS